MEESPSLYLLSLTRGRLVAVGLIVFGLFTLFFFLGLAVGVKSGEGAKPRTTVGETNVPFESTAELGLPEVAAPTAVQKREALPERPLPFTRSSQAARGGNFPQQSEPLSSSALLALDNPGAVTKKPPYKKSAEPLPSASKGAPGDHFYLQLLSSADKSKAEKVVAGFNAKGFKSYLRQRSDNGKQLYMVRVGPYDSRTKALADLNGFREKGYKDSYMVILRSGTTDAPKNTGVASAR